MSKHNAIVGEHKRSMPTLSAQTFHCGCIFLAGIVIGLVFFQIVDMPAGLSAYEEKNLRLAFGFKLGIGISIATGVAYILWTWLRIRKLTLRAEKQLFEASLKASRERK